MRTNLSNIYKDKSDHELVDLVKSDNNGEAFLEICARYENIFYKVCQKYSIPLISSGINMDDVLDEKNIIIFHCVNTFDNTKKTKLSTWIGNYARYLCLNSISSRKFIMPAPDEESLKKMEEIERAQEYLSRSPLTEDHGYFLNIISQLKDKRVGEVLKYRYFNDKKMIWTKIARKMKISTTTAINLHNRGIKILRKKVKSGNISDMV